MAWNVFPGGRSSVQPSSDCVDPFSDLISNLVRLLRSTGAEIVGFGRDEDGAFVDWRPAGADPSLSPMRSTFQRNPELRKELEAWGREEEDEVSVELDEPAPVAADTGAEAATVGIIDLISWRR